MGLAGTSEACVFAGDAGEQLERGDVIEGARVVSQVLLEERAAQRANRGTVLDRCVELGVAVE